MSTLTKKRRSRAGIINHINKIVKTDLAGLYESFSEEDLVTLKSFKVTLEEQLSRVSKLSEEIQEEIDDDGEFQADFDKFSDIEVSVRRDITQLQAFISDKERKGCSKPVSSNAAKSSTIKLPKIEIKKFKGDPTGWKTFSESFNAAVHSNKDLSDIEKMNFLLTYLEGEAENVVKGLALTNDNYKVALKMLKDRYGDPQVLISAHMARLLSLESVCDISEVKNLRKLYDEIETQVRSLQTLGLDPMNYGPMLTPVLLSKLPDDFKLIISRQFGKTAWDIQKVLEFYNTELEAREKVNFENEQNAEKPFTGSALFSGSTSRAKKPNRSGNDSFGKRADDKSPQSNVKCVFCGRSHLSRLCEMVTKNDVRKNILSKERRCFKCFKVGHNAFNCKSNIKCFKCDGKHHTAVCTFDSGKTHKETESEKLNSQASKNTETEEQETVTNFSSVTNNVLLQTAKAVVSSSDEKHSKTARLLFDTGAQLSYVSPKTRDDLKLPSIGQRTVEIKTFGNNKTIKTVDVVKIAVKSRDQSLNIFVTALVADICQPVEQQTIEIAQKKFDHLKQLPLADSNPGNIPLEIDVLIGADHYWDFILNRVVRGKHAEPVAIASHLGYILSGEFNPNQSSFVAHVSSCHPVASTHYLRVATEDAKTTPLVKDVFGKTDVKMSDDDAFVTKHFEETCYFENGHYTIDLPFKEHVDTLGDNYIVARNRLKSLLNTFKNNTELFIEYNRIINEQKNLGVLEQVTAEESQKVGGVYYMPHKPVVREEKSTTKVRMVFDASSARKSKFNSDSPAVSLNDTLYQGPSLATPLADVLLRLRSYENVILADIEKAFLQININPEHRDYVRFLWFEDPENVDFENFENNRLVEYKVCRVLFGLKPSPILLSATLIKHIMQWNASDPKFVSELLDGLHIDDLNSGKNSENEALEFYVKAKEILATGGFNLRKFQSNNPNLEQKVYDMFPEDQLFSDYNRILGILWDKLRDTFIFDFAEIRAKFDENPTKRSMLQSLASIYDPLGLITPVTVKMKNLYQNVCAEKIAWDTKLPSDILKEWQRIINSFYQIDQIIVGRMYAFVPMSDKITDVQMHSFSDASKDNFACNIYLRTEFASGNVKTSLVTSKSKVLVKKDKFTVPRAELLGALLMADQTKEITSVLKSVYDISEHYYWLDSVIVFCWILNGIKNSDSYIKRRLDKIKNCLVEKFNLKLVPSKLNPADIGTRGMSPIDLSVSDLWFKGPNFLSFNQEVWPNLHVGEKFVTLISNCCLKEDCLKKCIQLWGSSSGTLDNVSSLDSCSQLWGSSSGACLLCYANDLNANTQNELHENKEAECLLVENNIETTGVYPEKIINLEKFNSLGKLFRVTACVLKFIRVLTSKSRNTRKKHEEENLVGYNNNIFNQAAPEELDESHVVSDVDDLLAAKQLWIQSTQRLLLADPSRFKNLRKQLGVFEDDDGLLRCGGRLQHAKLSYDAKFPYVIPKNSHFARLAVLEAHAEVKHDGFSETLNQLRREFWIPRCRNFIKKVIHDCVLCKYFEGKPYGYPDTPPLPDFRVRNDFAFTYTGLDYCGPFYVKDVFVKKDMFKCWLALFTCANSRCIYLDLVPDYSGEACVDALIRFINSRGAPKLIVSDNGSNFTSGEVQDFVKSRYIRWKFTTEAAPWMGGFWERLVRSVKRCLKKVLRNTRLSFDELITVVKEIENIVNNRPLVYVSSDRDPNEEILTPNKLLYGRNLEVKNTIADVNDEVGDEVSPTKRGEHLNVILNHWWKRWQQDYLCELREYHRTKRQTSNVVPSVGDIVLIETEKLKRSDWRIGRVTDVIKGRDGKVRTAEVITKDKGTKLRRPVSRLYPIVTTDDELPTLKFVDEKNVPTHNGGGGSVR